MSYERSRPTLALRRENFILHKESTRLHLEQVPTKIMLHWLQFGFAFCIILHVQCALEKPDEGKIKKPDEPGDEHKNKLARGWGDSINWMPLEDGVEMAKKNKKPLMLLIHKTWCGACQTLKGKFAKAKMISEMSKNFIMVNAEDDEEPWEEEYYPDGGKYIPRILFLSPDGEVLKDVKNPKEEFAQYPYYYSNPAPVIHAMKSVLERYGLPVPGQEGADGQRKEEKKSKSDDKDAQPPSQKPDKEL